MTARFAVLGVDVRRSLSPRLHRALGAACGVDLGYEAISIPDPADFPRTVKNLRAAGYRGVNVTIPYKHAALALADEASPAASRIGAANCLSFDAAGVFADNTDAPALIAEMGAFAAPIRRAQVLGAGGAAAAVAFALCELGAEELVVSARDPRAAAELAARFGGSATPLEADPRAMLVVSALPPSAWTHASARWLDAGSGPRVYDLAYAEPGAETPLVGLARGLGLVARDGLGMLVEQAARAQVHWSGVALDRARAAMLAALASPPSL